MVKRYDLSVDDWNEVKLLQEPNGEYVTYADYEELEDELKRVNSSREWWRELGNRVVAERDQALAASAAIRERSVNDDVVERACRAHNVGWSLWHEPQKETAREVMRHALRSALPLSPDATAALNEMLADAWDEGQDTYREWPLEKNPYRKDRK